MMQELVQQVKSLVADSINQMHTVLPGKIVKFDTAKCLALVQPVGKFAKPDGTMMDLPQVSDVPIVFAQSANQQAAMAYPINEGDGCLLLFAEQALDCWRSGGEEEVKSDLKFDLTNCIAIPGLFVPANKLLTEACEKQAIIIEQRGKRIAVSEAGIVIRGDVTVEGNIKASGSISAGVGSLSAAGVLTVKKANIENGVSAQTVNVSGNLTAGGVNVNTHTHTSSLSGTDTSGPH